MQEHVPSTPSEAGQPEDATKLSEREKKVMELAQEAEHATGEKREDLTKEAGNTDAKKAADE